MLLQEILSDTDVPGTLKELENQPVPYFVQLRQSVAQSRATSASAASRQDKKQSKDSKTASRSASNLSAIADSIKFSDTVPSPGPAPPTIPALNWGASEDINLQDVYKSDIFEE